MCTCPPSGLQEKRKRDEGKASRGKNYVEVGAACALWCLSHGMTLSGGSALCPTQRPAPNSALHPTPVGPCLQEEKRMAREFGVYSGFDT